MRGSGAVRYVNGGLTHAKTFGRQVKVRVKPTGNSTSVYTIFVQQEYDLSVAQSEHAKNTVRCFSI